MQASLSDQSQKKSKGPRPAPATLNASPGPRHPTLQGANHAPCTPPPRGGADRASARALHPARPSPHRVRYVGLFPGLRLSLRVSAENVKRPPFSRSFSRGCPLPAPSTDAARGARRFAGCEKKSADKKARMRPRSARCKTRNARLRGFPSPPTPGSWRVPRFGAQKRPHAAGRGRGDQI